MVQLLSKDGRWNFVWFIDRELVNLVKLKTRILLMGGWADTCLIVPGHVTRVKHVTRVQVTWPWHWCLNVPHLNIGEDILTGLQWNWHSTVRVYAVDLNVRSITLEFIEILNDRSILGLWLIFDCVLCSISLLWKESWLCKVHILCLISQFLFWGMITLNTIRKSSDAHWHWELL